MRYSLLFLFLVLFHGSIRAHQPVMDMAPRWEDGYGFQFRYERYGSDKLLDSSTETANPLDLERYVYKVWIEGVYTFERSKRITFKLPYIDQRRTVNINNIGVRQKNSGIGDLVLGVPLKKYWNQGARTGNLSFTPSLRLPTGSATGPFPISDGSWDVGLSFAYNAETPKFYFLVDMFYWFNTSGKNGMHEGNELGLDVNLGYHPYHNNETNSGVFVMWDISARDNERPNQNTLTTFTGGQRVHTGPVLVLYRENVMFRAEFKVPVYESVDGIANSRGNEVSIGLGVTF